MAPHGSCKNLLLGVFKRPKRKESKHVDPTSASVPTIPPAKSPPLEGKNLNETSSDIPIVDTPRVDTEETASLSVQAASEAGPNEQDEERKDKRVEEEKQKDPGSHIRERKYKKDLWAEAYEKIREGNRGLVESYEEGLLKLGCDKEQTIVNSCDSRASQIQQLANQKIKELGNRQLVVKIGGEEKFVRSEVRQLAQRIVHGIVNVKDVISAAISSEPHAGLVWAGVLVILPVFLNIITQEEHAIEGLQSISDIIIRCHYMESELSSLDDQVELHNALKETTIDMYAKVLEYQIRFAVHYSKSRLLRYFDNVTASDDWSGILEEIEKINKKVDADLEAISRGTLQKIKNQMSQLSQMHTDIKVMKKSDLLKKLNAAPSASFDANAQGDIHCLPGTQTGVLKQIQSWVDNPEAPPIFWLHGMAGTGKSTIARTVAKKLSRMERLVDDKTLAGKCCLGGSFFFNQGDSDRNNPTRVFPTLAKNLAGSLPDLTDALCHAIEENDDIATKKIDDQWHELILQPLLDLQDRMLSCPTVVLVIDALDECQDRDSWGANIGTILQKFGELKDLKALKVRVLITSRPSDEIQYRFGVLSADTPDSHSDETLVKIPISRNDDLKTDIDLFFEHELITIRRRHKLSSDWPGKQKIRELVLKTDGLFIYAATTCRFLYERNGKAKNRLDMILRSYREGSSPQQGLDELYLKILQAELMEGLTETEKQIQRSIFQDIVGSILVIQDAPSVAALDLILPTSYQAEEELQNMLNRLGSVLHINQRSNDSVELLHLSFRDFLVDETRCGKEFHIDESKAHKMLFSRCVDIMNSTLRRNICQLERVSTRFYDVPDARVEEYLPEHAQYACCHWVDHLRQSGINDGRPLYDFLETHFTHWVEAMSWMGKLPEGILMLNDLLIYISDSSIEGITKLRAFVQDAKRFMITFRSVMEQAPLQIYVSALLFAPKRSLVREYFGKEIPKWIKKRPNMPEHWNPLLHTIQGHSDKVLCVRCSPDGKSVASASGDHTVRVWDVSTWRCLQVLRGHEAPVHTVEFLSNTSLLTAAIYETVRIWYLDTGESKVLNAPVSNYEVELSPDSTKLVCKVRDRGSHIYLYNLETQDLSYLTSGGFDGILFSPDSRRIVFHDEEHVYIWDAIAKAHLQTFNCLRPEKPVFSSDSKLVLYGSYGVTSGDIQSWELSTRRVQTCIHIEFNMYFNLEFSPDNTSVAVLSHRQVDLWDISEGRIMARLRSIEFSDSRDWKIVWLPNGEQVATVHETGIIYIWDVATESVAKTLKSPVSSPELHFSQDGGLMFTYGQHDHTFQAWDLTMGASADTNLLHVHHPNYVSFSANTQLVVSAAEDDDALRVWKTDTGELLRTFVVPEKGQNLPSLSANGERLICANRDGAVAVWDVATGDRLQILNPIPDLEIPDIAITSDGRTVASADWSVIRFWDVSSGDLLSEIKTQWAQPLCPRFSPDDAYIAVGSPTACKIFNIPTLSLTTYLEGGVDCLAISPDNFWIATAESCDRYYKTASEVVHLWETTTGKKKGTIQLAKPIFQMTFSDDGTCLYTDQGRISIDSILQSTYACSGQVGEGIRYSDGWVHDGEQEIILLPPEWGPDDYYSRFREVSASKDGILVFSNRSGGVVVIEFGEGVIGSLE
ncbi:quinon protein alcohol dehydrogenase-like superfamily [Aspergillus parasiticus]|uniref:Mitochondrial division protein 1 n=1 Tax=Aspergillus parasiticus TaxID=5067 RepID=A0A5N6DS53_ASPPA|nr:quinon protein alcohol dehydrogenase-like superfamily [Aspergillus parasiticus]